MTESRDCPNCGTPLLVLDGFSGVVVSHECVQCSWKTPLRELVDHTIFTLFERRPFKHDLPKMQEDYPGGYEEMLQEMESYAADVLGKFGVKLP